MPAFRPTARLLAIAAAGLGTVVTLGSPGPATAAAPRFGAPVLLTVDDNAGGYEPGVVVDKFGNVVVTAHKQNHSLVISPDRRSSTQTRSMSWVWWSRDFGKTFSDMPGLTLLGEQNAEFGDEGDLAWDATGHIYFVDTNVADISFTRWKASGRGEIALEHTVPAAVMGQAVDDRPWVAAHGDGIVMYLGNEGDKQSYPAGSPPLNSSGDPANGGGRYTAYMSYDHGDTWDHAGYTLKDSGWCRPLTDRRASTHAFYVVCSNDTGKHYVYVSTDDGHHWTRYDMGTYRRSSWINGAVGPDGTLYAQYHDTDEDGDNHLMLYTSRNGGKTWKKVDVTQGSPGRIAYSWMDVSAKGTIGIAYYGSPDGKKSWYLYAGSARPGQRLSYGRVSSRKLIEDQGTPWGDFFQIAFDLQDKLNVVWTENAAIGPVSGLNSQIYYARQL